MRTSKPFIKNRNKLGASKPIFVPNLVSGNSLKDIISQTGSTTSISGARWGIVNGVVAQFAANQPRIEDEGFGACPAFTQLAKMTETLTDVNWIKNNILTPVLVGTFQGQNIWNCVENTTANAVHQISQSGIYGALSDNSVIGISVAAKYNGRKLFLAGQGKDGLYKTCRIDLQGGVVESHSGVAASATALGDGYYIVLFAFNVASGATTPSMVIQTHNGVSNQYTGDGVSGVYLGQPTYINFGVNGIPFIPPYVPNNTTSSVSVVSEAGGTSFDLDLATLSRLKTGLRGPNAQGHIEIEFESNVDSGWLANSTALNLFAINNNNVSGGLYYWKNSSGVLSFRASDNTNLAEITGVALTVGQTFKISIDYGTYTDGSQKMRLTVNGVKSSVVAFSGSFGAQDLRFFFGNTVHAGWIKNLKYYERPRW